MRDSIKGGQLPESEEDYIALTVNKGLRHNACVNCSSPFSSANTHTAAGWAETQISGFCEDCFDDIFQEEP